MDMNLLFPGKSRSRKPKEINYDVRITSNMCGHGQRVRFAFYNLAAQVFGQHDFVEVSNLEYVKDRIYFRLHDGEKLYRKMLKISSNHKSKQNCFYIAMTPATEKTEKMFRMSWINKTYNLLFDEECALYYIEKAKEDKTNA